jgi:glycosyl transferase family 2
VSLPGLLDRATRPTLVLRDPSLALPSGSADVTAAVLGHEDPGYADERWGCVVLAVPDRAALRRVARGAPRVGRARAVVAWLETAGEPVVPGPRPEWPEVVESDAHLTDQGGAVTRLRFLSPVPVHEVVGQLGRDAGSPGVAGHGGLVVGHDPDADSRVPADVVVGGSAVEPSAVTGRAPLAVAALPEPVDEGVFTPAGFRRDWDRGVVTRADLPSGPVTDVAVAALRDAQGVRVGRDTTAYDVAALAMAGVPLVSDGVPDGLAPALAEVATADPDLDDPLRREEHSVRLRRAAAAGHSILAWRTDLAARAGVRVAGPPSVSILLATRRPEMLPFALTQVAKQAGARIEVVLAAHGFDVDEGLVRDRLGDRPVVIRSVPAETRFGDVLDTAARAASGDLVLKMDDDDWYGPDVVADLLWARRTSGAELVGMAAEFVYLEPIDITVRRRTTVERAAKVVAGGTMLLDASYLRELGGFRSVTRFVDAQLLTAVRRAGGTVHRTQGLGYVLRRGGGGHTWSTDLGYFLTRRSVVGQWRGFRPSALLGYDESERPAVGVR